MDKEIPDQIQVGIDFMKDYNKINFDSGTYNNLSSS